MAYQPPKNETPRKQIPIQWILCQFMASYESTLSRLGQANPHIRITDILERRMVRVDVHSDVELGYVLVDTVQVDPDHLIIPITIASRIVTGMCDTRCSLLPKIHGKCLLLIRPKADNRRIQVNRAGAFPPQAD